MDEILMDNDRAERTMDNVVELLRPIVAGGQATFRSKHEVVLHDYREPKHADRPGGG